MSTGLATGAVEHSTSPASSTRESISQSAGSPLQTEQCTYDSLTGRRGQGLEIYHRVMVMWPVGDKKKHTKGQVRKLIQKGC